MGMHLGVSVAYGSIIPESDLYESNLTVKQAVNWDESNHPEVSISRPDPENMKDRRFFLWVRGTHQTISYSTYDLDPRSLVHFRDFRTGKENEYQQTLKEFCQEYHIPYREPDWSLHWYIY